jgi:hypothetical protein
MALLTDHRDALDRLTGLLLERETVDGTDVDEVLGRIPGQRQPIGATGHSASAAAPGPITAAPATAAPAGADQPHPPVPGPPVGERSPTAGAGGSAVHSPPDASGPADA